MAHQRRGRLVARPRRRHARRAGPGRHVPLRRRDPVRARAVGPVGRPRRRRGRRQAPPAPGAQLPARSRRRRGASWSRPASASGSTTRRGRCAAYEGPWIVPALETAGLRCPRRVERRGDEPPPLRPRRRPAAGRRRARPSRTPRSWPSGRSGRSRSATTRGSWPRTSSRSCAWSRTGARRAGPTARRSSCRASRSCRPAATRPGHQAIVVAVPGDGARTLAFFGDLLHAAVGGQPALGHRLRRLPARFGRPQGRAVRARPPTRAGSSCCRTRRDHPVGRLVRDRDRFRFEPRVGPG